MTIDRNDAGVSSFVGRLALESIFARLTPATQLHAPFAWQQRDATHRADQAAGAAVLEPGRVSAAVAKLGSQTFGFDFRGALSHATPFARNTCASASADALSVARLAAPPVELVLAMKWPCMSAGSSADATAGCARNSPQHMRPVRLAQHCLRTSRAQLSAASRMN